MRSSGRPTAAASATLADTTAERARPYGPALAGDPALARWRLGGDVTPSEAVDRCCARTERRDDGTLVHIAEHGPAPRNFGVVFYPR